MRRILNLKIWMLSSLVGLPVLADAGERGNGGDAVVCYNSRHRIISVEMLDLYEARELLEYQIDMGAENLDYHAKLEILLTRVHQFDEERAKKYREMAASFESEAVFPDGALVDIPDSQHIVVPDHCKIEQIAIHKNPQFPGEKRYTIAKDLWDRLPAASRASLIMHEIIYREALSLEHEDSRATRALNAFISQAGLTIGRYVNTLKAVGFVPPATYRHRGFLFYLSHQFWRDGGIQWARSVDDIVWQLPTGQVVSIPRGKHVEFHQNGEISQFHLRSPATFPVGEGEITVFESAQLYPVIKVYSSGKLRSPGYVFTSQGIDFKIAGQAIHEAGSYVEFYESGIPKFGSLLNDASLPQIGECSLKLVKDQGVTQSEEMKIIKATTALPQQLCFPIPQAEGFHKTYVPESIVLSLQDSGLVFKMNIDSQGARSVELPVLGTTAYFLAHAVEFHENGIIKQARLYSATQLLTENGQQKEFPTNVILNFDELGRVIE